MGLRKVFSSSFYAKYGFHQLDSYLRWVANSDVPIQNINDLSKSELLPSLLKRQFVTIISNGLSPVRRATVLVIKIVTMVKCRIITSK